MCRLMSLVYIEMSHPSFLSPQLFHPSLPPLQSPSLAGSIILAILGDGMLDGGYLGREERVMVNLCLTS